MNVSVVMIIVDKKDERRWKMWLRIKRYERGKKKEVERYERI
jgi:Fe-S cluster assembly scaffold protein SufB